MPRVCTYELPYSAGNLEIVMPIDSIPLEVIEFDNKAILRALGSDQAPPVRMRFLIAITGQELPPGRDYRHIGHFKRHSSNCVFDVFQALFNDGPSYESAAPSQAPDNLDEPTEAELASLARISGQPPSPHRLTPITSYADRSDPDRD